jgi:transcriptional regulator with XRE-family HTH domain
MSLNAFPAQQGQLGVILREWRAARRISQLDLALEANVSARHLSCVESGKAQPSRELITRLADALDMPLRERNAMLIAAGYAPEYRETSLAKPEMAPIRRAVELTLTHHEPFPAFVMNRQWDVLMTNGAFVRLLGRLRGAPPKNANIVRQIFDPEDMRPYVANWEEVASDVMRHLHAEMLAAPSDVKKRALLKEALSYPEVPARWRVREPGAAPVPLLTTMFASGDISLQFFSTITMFGATHDVTIEELRIECMFPADDATADFCRSLAP